MTQSFDEWFDKNDVRILVERSTARFVYEAGAQSKQAEIDELQKRIGAIERHIEMNFDQERNDDQHSYWSGYNHAMRELYEILRGGDVAPPDYDRLKSTKLKR